MEKDTLHCWDTNLAIPHKILQNFTVQTLSDLHHHSVAHSSPCAINTPYVHYLRTYMFTHSFHGIDYQISLMGNNKSNVSTDISDNNTMPINYH